MGNRQIRAVKAVLIKYGSKVFNRVMEMTTADIKVNRIPFGRRTNSKDFMEIFYMNLNVYLRSCKM